MKTLFSDRWQGQGTFFFWLLTAFLAAWWLPVEQAVFMQAIHEGLALVRWYAREHVILCLLPAFFIAGAISVYIKKDSVLRTLGPLAPRWLAYSVASVSGSVLAVCSCTVLPLFAGIYKRGAGLGPASAFLYSGPAINVLAILMTAKVLGWELSLARGLGAVLFSVVIGLLMAFVFRKEESRRAETAPAGFASTDNDNSMGRGIRLVGLQMLILIFANWSAAGEPGSAWSWIHEQRWLLTGLLALPLAWFLHRDLKLPVLPIAAGVLTLILIALSGWLHPVLVFALSLAFLSLILLPRDDEAGDWLDESWSFAKQIMPLLLAGVFVAGLLLGRPDQQGLVPAEWVAAAVGGNSLLANFLSSLVGSLMYFATLTEIPILQGLLGAGMGKGPALALLLAGPALSLPNMLVIRSVLGNKKTTVFVLLVVILSTLAGWLYGMTA